MDYLLLSLVFFALLPNLYVAGMHDVANSIAIPVRTRALTPRIAARLAAFFNAAGVLLAMPVGVYLYSWFEFPHVPGSLMLSILLSTLISLLAWNILTYLRGAPSSTTHALLAGLLGGGFAAAVLTDTTLADVLQLPWLGLVLALLLSPLLAFGLAYALVFGFVRMARGEDPDSVNSTSRMVQSICVGITSLGTGLQQGQRFAFVALLGLASAGVQDAAAALPYLFAGFAVLIGMGCLSGGWRIGHILGHRLVALDPLRGMVSASTTSGLVILGSIGLEVPLSTSLTAASATMGAGSNQRFTTVNWRQFLRILSYWVATPVVTGAGAAVLTLAMNPLLGLP